MNRTVLLTALPIILSLFAITGCEQDKPTAKTTPPTVVKKYTQATTLEGMVSNNDGVIKTGTVAASDENGRAIAHIEPEAD